jgi:hypothetical protein
MENKNGFINNRISELKKEIEIGFESGVFDKSIRQIIIDVDKELAKI